MKEPSTDWQREVRESLALLGNIEEQRKAWISSGRDFYPDAVELCIRLLDDFRFADFLKQNIKGKDRKLYMQGIEILRLLEGIGDEELCDSIAILENSDWQEAAMLCASFSIALARW
jgi:hypothetical protein